MSSLPLFPRSAGTGGEAGGPWERQIALRRSKDAPSHSPAPSSHRVDFWSLFMPKACYLIDGRS
jgi:hypothetical protein